MDFKIHKLASGLRVMIIPMPSLESATVTVWVKTGSRNEESGVLGISHFLEHMVFKGSKKRPTAREISQVVDSIGGEFNAATSKEWTNFYVKSRAAKLETAMDVLSDMVFSPLLKEEEIEREKGTILQEIAMYEDTPMIKIGDVFEELIFDGHPLSWDTAGVPKSVKNIKRSDFLSYIESHYDIENIIIVIAGGVDEEKVLELSKKYFGKFQKKETLKGQNIEDFKVSQNIPQIKLKNKKSDQAHLIMGFLADGRSYKNRYAQGVLSVILGGGMSSRLFIEIRERRGLAYAVRTGMERYREVGYISTYVGTDPSKAKEVVKVILDQSYGLVSNAKYRVTPAELVKAKEYLKGHLALALEDTRDVAMFFGEQALFLPEILTPESVYKKIDGVSVEDIENEAKRLFTPERLNLAVIGPFKDKEEFVKSVL